MTMTVILHWYRILVSKCDQAILSSQQVLMNSKAFAPFIDDL
jgi:hypothetical protein